jgi:hypothetical protein
MIHWYLCRQFILLGVSKTGAGGNATFTNKCAKANNTFFSCFTNTTRMVDCSILSTQTCRRSVYHDTSGTGALKGNSGISFHLESRIPYPKHGARHTLKSLAGFEGILELMQATYNLSNIYAQSTRTDTQSLTSTVLV